MISYISDKTSLLDLSINELRHVDWKLIELRDFKSDLNDKKFLDRMAYADSEVLINMLDYKERLLSFEEDAVAFLIDLKLASGSTGFTLDGLFYGGLERQFSLDFLKKYKSNINFYYAEYQQSITPEFLEEIYNEMDTDEFWSSFSNTFKLERIAEFYNYKDGMFRKELMDSEAYRFMTKADLAAIGIEAPDYYDNIMTEQRIMSGEPCNDGQRSFSIWMRRYRRVYNDPTGYPTWDNLLEMHKKHPRMNENGYISWIYYYALTKTDLENYEEHLSYSPTRITINDYENVTGSDEAATDFEIEFRDVFETKEESTESLQTSSEMPRPWDGVAVTAIRRDPVTGRFI